MNATIFSFSPQKKPFVCTVDVFDCISEVNSLKSRGFNVYEVDTDEGERFFVSTSSNDNFEQDFSFFVLNKDKLSKNISGEEALRIWKECGKQCNKE